MPDKTMDEELETLEETSPPEPKPEPELKPKPEPEPGQLALTARQFCRARGMRWERSAGWLYYAGAKYGEGHRLTVSEWQAIWDAWWQQPAGQPVRRED